jgi:predicted NUDIX family phosphoesterase
MPMDAAAHDRAVAGVSHLPLVVAAALVESVNAADDGAGDWPVASALAAGGWASATRLAAGSPEMGAGILATNADEVRMRIAALRRTLERWEASLDAGVAAQADIEARLADARDRLRAESERILVVPRDAIMDDDGWYGLRTTDPEPFLEAVRRTGRFEPRGRMETDPRYKQVIPYLVLRDGERIFLMRRTRGGGDARLHDRWSIGVGGHVGPNDGDLEGGLVREWREEMDASFVPAFRLVGLLNDDTTDVGRVHVGAVFIADVQGRPVTVRETDKLVGSFVELPEALAVADVMETWSRILIGPIADGTVR